LSSIAILLLPPVWIAAIVWFASFTTLGVSAFGTAPAITGRSGSPSMNVSSTSVPLCSGKCIPCPAPAYGCIIRTHADAFPSFRPDWSNGSTTLYRPCPSSSAYCPLPAPSTFAFSVPYSRAFSVTRAGRYCTPAATASNVFR